MKDKNNINDLINTKANEEKIENNISPKVSIIVPIYNVEKYLRQCLDSIVNQTLKDIEIILVDDGSTDSCPSICDEYASKDKRIIVIHKENAGLGAAYNTGLDIAKGDYIGFVESDDWIESNMYEELYNKAVETGVDVVKSLYTRAFENDKFIVVNKFVTSKYCNQIVDDAKKVPEIYSGHVSHWSAIYKRELIFENNIRFAETEGASCQDVSFAFLAYFYAKSAFILEKSFYNYREESEGSSRTKGFKIALSSLKMREIISNLISNLQVEPFYKELEAKKIYQALMNDIKFRTPFNKKMFFIKQVSKLFKKYADDIEFKFFNPREKKEFLQIAKSPVFYHVKNSLIQIKMTKEVSSVKLFNFLPIYFNKRTKGYQSFRIFHLPIHRGKTVDNTYKRYFFLVPYFKKITKNNMVYKYLFGFLYRESLIYKQIDEQDITKTIGNMLSCQKTHQKTFPKYKNKHAGQDIAIFATGPSLNFAPTLKNTINIACNRAIEEYEKFKFDYFFAIDYPNTKDYIENVFSLDCVKFLGRYFYNNSDMVYRRSIPEYLYSNHKIEEFYTEVPLAKNIYHNIEIFPLFDFFTIVHPALHFSIYTNPKRIFLIGCDTANNGYFDNKYKKDVMNTKKIIEGYKKIKQYADVFYPNVEIISINPVGLKGIFRDVYTRDFLQDKSEINLDEIEFFEDFVKKEEF